MRKLRKILIRKRRKDESLFKYTMGLFHLWGALVSFLVICTICLTGCIYAFETQIIDLYNYDKVFIQSADTPIDVNKIQEDFTQKAETLPRFSSQKTRAEAGTFLTQMRRDTYIPLILIPILWRSSAPKTTV